MARIRRADIRLPLGTGTNWDELGLESWEYMAIFMGFSGHLTIITGDNLWDIKPSWDISEDIPMI
jgi:hypothetical protein